MRLKQLFPSRHFNKTCLAVSGLKMLVMFAFLVVFGCGRSVVAPDGLGPESPSSDSQLSIAHPEPTIRTAPEIVKSSTVLLDMAYTYCSGTIVSEERILTAAHCVKDLHDAQEIIVRFGPDVSDMRYGRLGRNQPKVHPKLDLAVVQFAGGVPSGYRVAPIFSADVRLYSGDEVILAGYGKTEAELENYAEYLRWGTTNFVTFLEQIDYSDGQQFRSILKFVDNVGQSATCGGDSGGPMFREVNGKWGLTGVISGGPRDCHLYGETLAADPRPNHTWIFQNLPQKTGSCSVLDSGGGANTNMRLWDLQSDVVAVVDNGVQLDLAIDQSSRSIQRKFARLIGYVKHTDTSCAADLSACVKRFASVFIKTTRDERAGSRGAFLRSAPRGDAAERGLIVSGNVVRVIERQPDGWLKVIVDGTVGQNSCL